MVRVEEQHGSMIRGFFVLHHIAWDVEPLSLVEVLVVLLAPQRAVVGDAAEARVVHVAVIAASVPLQLEPALRGGRERLLRVPRVATRPVGGASRRAG